MPRQRCAAFATRGAPQARRLAQLLAYEVAQERTPMHAEPFRETRTDPIYTASDALIRKRSGFHAASVARSAPTGILRAVKVDRRTRRGLLISAIAAISVGFLLSLIARDLGGAVWSVILAGVCVWLLLRLRDDASATGATRRQLAASRPRQTGGSAASTTTTANTPDPHEGRRRCLDACGPRSSCGGSDGEAAPARTSPDSWRQVGQGDRMPLS